MKYIKRKDIEAYLDGKIYSSISVTGSLKGMRKNYGWNMAKEIIKSGSYYYAFWD